MILGTHPSSLSSFSSSSSSSCYFSSSSSSPHFPSFRWFLTLLLTPLWISLLFFFLFLFFFFLFILYCSSSSFSFSSSFYILSSPLSSLSFSFPLLSFLSSSSFLPYLKLKNTLSLFTITSRPDLTLAWPFLVSQSTESLVPWVLKSLNGFVRLYIVC